MKKVIFFIIMAVISIVVLSSCKNSEYKTVMEYNGIELKENMYFYWLSTYKRNILYSYEEASDTPEFWSSEIENGVTLEEYFTDKINNKIMDYLISQSLFKENRLKLSDETKSSITNDINEKIEYYGGKSKLNSELKSLKIDIDDLKTIYTWESKSDCVYNYYFGQNGIDEISDEKIINYYKSNYSNIKYIVFYLSKIQTDDKGNYQYDENGELLKEKLTDKELNDKYKIIDECYTKLKNGYDFEELNKSYSEYDTSAYENGFFISSNELQIWGPQILSACIEAKEGDVLRVDESDAVYLIIKNKLPDLSELSDSDQNQLSKLSVYATNEVFEERFSELRKKVTVSNEVISNYSISKIKANSYYSF